jgi:hypothetical protein
MNVLVLEGNRPRLPLGVVKALPSRWMPVYLPSSIKRSGIEHYLRCYPKEIIRAIVNYKG